MPRPFNPRFTLAAILAVILMVPVVLDAAGSSNSAKEPIMAPTIGEDRGDMAALSRLPVDRDERHGSPPRPRQAPPLTLITPVQGWTTMAGGVTDHGEPLVQALREAGKVTAASAWGNLRAVLQQDGRSAGPQSNQERHEGRSAPLPIEPPESASPRQVAALSIILGLLVLLPVVMSQVRRWRSRRRAMRHHAQPDAAVDLQVVLDMIQARHLSTAVPPARRRNRRPKAAPVRHAASIPTAPRSPGTVAVGATAAPAAADGMVLWDPQMA